MQAGNERDDDDSPAGTLYRAGPGRIRVGEHLYGHWFDGDGAVSAPLRRSEACACKHDLC